MSDLPGSDARGRWASFVLGDGVEPDPRFTLANERTFLAWIRTSLALLAGAIGLAAFAAGVFSPLITEILVIGLILAAMTISALACWRWVAVERAMRRQQPLPLNLLGLALALGVAIASGIVAVGYYLSMSPP